MCRGVSAHACNHGAAITHCILHCAQDLAIFFHCRGWGLTCRTADDHAIIAGLNEVRSNGSPHFLALHTYRLAPHSKGDDTRSAAELAEYRARDPLLRLRSRLPAADVATIDSQIEARLAAAVAAALADAPMTLAEFQERARWQPA